MEASQIIEAVAALLDLHFITAAGLIQNMPISPLKKFMLRELLGTIHLPETQNTVVRWGPAAYCYKQLGALPAELNLVYGHFAAEFSPTQQILINFPLKEGDLDHENLYRDLAGNMYYLRDTGSVHDYFCGRVLAKAGNWLVLTPYDHPENLGSNYDPVFNHNDEDSYLSMNTRMALDVDFGDIDFSLFAKDWYVRSYWEPRACNDPRHIGGSISRQSASKGNVQAHLKLLAKRNVTIQGIWHDPQINIATIVYIPQAS